MIPNVKRLVGSAIRNRRRMLIRYDGKERSRVIEPHMLYYSRNGGMNLLAYQIRGYHSSKRKGSYWRPFQLSKIDSIYVTEETFQARQKEGYSAVSKLVRGDNLVSIDTSPDRYCYFNPAMFGPPTPAYLAATPSQMLQLAAKANATAGEQQPAETQTN